MSIKPSAAESRAATVGLPPATTIVIPHLKTSQDSSRREYSRLPQGKRRLSETHRLVPAAPDHRIVVDVVDRRVEEGFNVELVHPAEEVAPVELFAVVLSVDGVAAHEAVIMCLIMCLSEC